MLKTTTLRLRRVRCTGEQCRKTSDSLAALFAFHKAVSVYHTPALGGGRIIALGYYSAPMKAAA